MGAFKTVMLASFLGLAACAPSQQDTGRATFSLAETGTPVELFSASCLQTLPNFKAAPNVVKKRGFEVIQREASLQLLKAPGNKILASVQNTKRDELTCGVAFLGASQTKAVDDLFLTEATKQTGGTRQKRLATSFFDYAYDLKNGSVITHDVRRKINQVRHIVLMSPPIHEDQIANYIYK